LNLSERFVIDAEAVFYVGRKFLQQYVGGFDQLSTTAMPSGSSG